MCWRATRSPCGAQWRGWPMEARHLSVLRSDSKLSARPRSHPAISQSCSGPGTPSLESGHRDWQLHCPSPCQLARTGSRRRLRVPFRVGACFPSTWRPSRRDVRRRTLRVDAPSGTAAAASRAQAPEGWLLRACSSPRRSRASRQCPLAVAREQSKWGTWPLPCGRVQWRDFKARKKLPS